MTLVAVVGVGAIGTRAARQLAATPEIEVLVADVDRTRSAQVAAALGGRVRAVGPDAVDDADVVLLAHGGTHGQEAERTVRSGRSVVSVTDDVDDVKAMMALAVTAQDHGATIVVGASFAPGLSCLLARYAAGLVDTVQEIHVAKHGTGGPDCARQHHLALAQSGPVWRDGMWIERAGGSGRELIWFPDPIQSQDCYNAAVPDPLLLVSLFADIERVSARTSATRRDRLTARLPMMRAPHPEGRLGAIRVEVRGMRGGVRVSEIFGAIDRPAIAAGAVAAVSVLQVVARRSADDPAIHGTVSLADPRFDTVEMLKELARRGVKGARFVGEA